MTVLLKMHASGEIFDKICLKAIRDTFFQYVVCDQGTGELIFSVVVIQQKGKTQTFWFAERPPKFSPLVGHPDPPIRKTLLICLLQ